MWMMLNLVAFCLIFGIAIASQDCDETLPFAHPTNRSKFLVCAPYGIQEMDCAPGTKFNPDIHVCDSSQETNISLSCNQTLPFAHPTNSSRYLVCAPYGIQEMDCAPGTLYNPEIHVCDWPQNVRCNSSTTSKPTSPEPENGCNQTLPFAHPTNCSKYLMCAPDGIQEMDCAPGTHFNPLINVCDWPQNVKCVSGENNESTSTTTEISVISTGKPVECNTTKLWADRKNCSRFIVCAAGKNITQDCPAGLYFNVKDQICDWPQNVWCPTAPINVTTTTSTEAPVSTTAVPVECNTTKLWPDRKNCSRYVVCAAGKNVTQECPAGLYFNVKDQICDWPQNVWCPTAPINVTTTTSTEAPVSTTAVPVECNTTKLWPDRKNCSRYVVCAAGKNVTQECPAGLYFNVKDQICDWPQNVWCPTAPINVTTTTSTEAPVSTTAVPVECNTTKLWPDRKNCSRYVVCAAGKNVTQECPAGLYFNVKDQICDWPQNVWCPTAPINVTTTTSTEAPVSTTAVPVECNTTKLWPDRKNCSRYVVCAAGKNVTQECPAGLYFNVKDQICDWPQNVWCPTAPINVTTTTSTEAPVSTTAVPVECNTTKLWPDRKNCSRYVVCAAGKNVTQECPAGLYFNVKDQICDWPQNVWCPTAPINVTTTTSTEAPVSTTAVPVECNTTKLWPDRKNCSRYVVCAAGKNVTQECPAGLYFNVKDQICDWPQNVWCPTAPINVTTTTSTEAPVSTTAVPVECNTTKLWPDRKNCSRYVVCAAGKNVTQECPAGLYFNVKDQICDWPQNVWCPTAPINVTTTTSTEAPVSTTAVPVECNTTKLWPDRKNCSRYVVCAAGKNVTQECPAGLYFNVKDQICDWPQNVWCPTAPINVTTTTSTEAPVSTTAVPVECNTTKLWPDRKNCSRYVVCAAGKNVTQECPAGLYFNVKDQICDWPQNVWCPTAPINVTTTTSTEAPVSTTAVPVECNTTKLWPDRKNCSRYVVCAAGKNVTQECPAGLYFNVKEQMCDWPQNVWCPTAPINVTTTTSTEAPVSTTAVPVECNTTKLWPDRKNCSRYVVCAAGKNVTQECPAGLYFNVKEQMCDWPQNVWCPTAPINVTTTTSTEAPVSTTAVPVECNTTKLWPDRKNCSRYVVCAAGKNVTQECPAGLYFNVKDQICDWPQNVWCPTAPINVTTTTSTEAPVSTTAVPVECNTTKLWPDRKNCSRYVVCAAGKNVTQECPAGLYFNVKEQMCDWPHNVWCPTAPVNVTTTRNTEAPIIPTTSPSGCNETNLLPYPNNCSKFIVCTPAGSETLDCPQGLYFSPSKQACDWPENVACPTYPTITSDDPIITTTSPGTEHNVCNETSVFPHPTDCEKYILCTKDGSETFRCPNGLYFNQSSLVCELSKNINCSPIAAATTQVPDAPKTTVAPSTSEGGKGTDDDLITLSTTVVIDITTKVTSAGDDCDENGNTDKGTSKEERDSNENDSDKSTEGNNSNVSKENVSKPKDDSNEKGSVGSKEKGSNEKNDDPNDDSKEIDQGEDAENEHSKDKEYTNYDGDDSFDGTGDYYDDFEGEKTKEDDYGSGDDDQSNNIGINEETDVDGEVTATTTQAQSYKDPSDICLAQSGSFFFAAHPSDCSQYVVCNYGQTFVLSCGEKFFNAATDSCQDDSSVCR